MKPRLSAHYGIQTWTSTVIESCTILDAIVLADNFRKQWI